MYLSSMPSARSILPLVVTLLFSVLSMAGQNTNGKQTDGLPSRLYENVVRHAKSGEFTEALQLLSRAGQDGDSQLRRNLSRFMEKMGIRIVSSTPQLAEKYLAAADQFGENRPLEERIGTLNNLGNIKKRLSKLDDAKKVFEQAVTLAGGLRSKHCDLTIRTFINTAGLELKRRYYVAADRHIRNARNKKCRKVSAVRAVDASLTMGAIYRQQGDFGNAEREYKMASKLLKDNKIPKKMKSSLTAETNRLLGELYIYHEFQTKKAAQYLTRAIKEHQNLSEILQVALAKAHLAEIEHLRENYSKAIISYDSLRGTFRSLGATGAEARTLYHHGRALGALRSKQSKPDEAIEKFSESIALYQRIEDREWIWRGLMAKGRQQERIGEIVAAANSYEQAIHQFESIGDDVAGGEQARDQFGESYRRLYERAIELELAKKVNDWQKINSLVRRSRSRELRQSLLFGPEGEKCRDIVAELSVASGYDYRVSRPISGTKAATSVPASNQQQTLAPAYESAVVVQYYVSDHGLVIKVSKPDGELDTLSCDNKRDNSLCISRENLESTVLSFLDSIRKPEGGSIDQKLLDLSSSLHALLISPIEGYFGKERVILIPSGVLELVPFVALAKLDEQGKPDFLISRVINLQQRLISSFANSSATNEGIGRDLKVASVVNPRIGNPELEPTKKQELPIAETLARNEIGRLYPKSKVFAKDKATKNNLRQALASYDVLHVGAHAVLTQSTPYIQLAPGGAQGRLTPCEIMVEASNVKAKLVVLAACQSAVSPQSTDATNRERLDSLSAAFTKIGVPRVIGTLWKVSAEGTSKVFMQRFYETLHENDGFAGIALAAVQREFAASDGRYAHPYYWAGYIYMSQ